MIQLRLPLAVPLLFAPSLLLLGLLDESVAFEVLLLDSEGRLSGSTTPFRRGCPEAKRG